MDDANCCNSPSIILIQRCRVIFQGLFVCSNVIMLYTFGSPTFTLYRHKALNEVVCAPLSLHNFQTDETKAIQCKLQVNLWFFFKFIKVKVIIFKNYIILIINRSFYLLYNNIIMFYVSNMYLNIYLKMQVNVFKISLKQMKVGFQLYF